ncbi:predicted protein [Postia placenta Mad-698-R]|nr:predicted protein [Postia placenta Mad-698-R]
MSVYATDDDAAPRQYSEEMFKLSPDLGSRHRIYLACALQPTTANDPTSPHRPHIDGVVRFSPPMSSSAPDDLENELLGRIEYDKIEIFGRLKLQLVDDNLVHQCRLAFDRDDRVAEAKDKLKTHVAFADGLSIDDLDDQQCRSLLNSGEWELEMYPHLRTLFDFITDFSPATCLRRLVETPGPLQDDDNSHTLGFLKAVPDFSLLNEAPLQAKASEQPHLWSDTFAFCVVKPSNKQSPKPEDPSDVVSLITLQSSQYARLYACSRPFRLFAVCLLIFGSGFCVGIFDRSGLMLSPIYDMWEHTDVFIRVIRGLTSVATDVDLGQDPTVRPLPNDMARSVLGESEPPVHTSYIVEPIGDDERVWCTIGSPVWSSLSLFGRGTWVWYVREYDANGRCLKGAKMIMKTAWRQGNRSSESIIHRSIKGEHRGLAKLLVGADVEYRVAGQHPERMSVRYLRSGQNDVNAGSPVLHRLVFSTVGRPLWEYESELELLLGVRAALDAHEFLCDQGIIHRDISPSNILLRDKTYDPDSEPDGGEGFLIDLEFARPPDVVTATEGVGDSQRSYSRWIHRGAPLTGNVQFMALDILRAIKNRSTSIEHTASHDVESFIWVLGYCVLRKLVNKLVNKVPSTDPGREAVEEAFHDAFGHNNVRSVLISRRACMPLVWLTGGSSKPKQMLGPIRENISVAMAALFGNLRNLLSRETFYPVLAAKMRGSDLPAEDPPITHAILREMLDTTITYIHAGGTSTRSSRRQDSRANIGQSDSERNGGGDANIIGPQRTSLLVAVRCCEHIAGELGAPSSASSRAKWTPYAELQQDKEDKEAEPGQSLYTSANEWQLPDSMRRQNELSNAIASTGPRRRLFAPLSALRVRRLKAMPPPRPNRRGVHLAQSAVMQYLGRMFTHFCTACAFGRYDVRTCLPVRRSASATLFASDTAGDDASWQGPAALNVPQGSRMHDKVGLSNLALYIFFPVAAAGRSKRKCPGDTFFFGSWGAG